MAIKLSLFTENDLEGNPALFVTLSSLPDNENAMGLGLGAQMRRFHFTRDLIQALSPANFERHLLEGLANDLERGRAHQLEISNEQAWNIGMLPHQDGHQWVQVTVRKVQMGDGSFRFCEGYRAGERYMDPSGSSLETSLPDLEARVRKYVAVDWAEIGTQLERQDTWNGVLHLPDETVRYIFEGEQ